MNLFRICFLKVSLEIYRYTCITRCFYNFLVITEHAQVLLLFCRLIQSIFYSASIGTPINVTATTITPTSINISWNSNTINNCVVITLYEVKYTWPLQSGQLGISYMNTSGAQTQFVLSALQECVQYNISVRAYTIQGPGPFSKPVLDSSHNGEFGNT